MLRGKCAFCSLGFLILDFALPLLATKGETNAIPILGRHEKQMQVCIRPRQQLSNVFPKEGLRAVLGGALIYHGKHQPINHVHSHAQNGGLFLLYKNIQETRKTAIRLMKSIKGHQIQRHERPQRCLQNERLLICPSSGFF